MMTKEKYVSNVRRLADLIKVDREFEEAFWKWSPDSGSPIVNGAYKDLVVKALQEATDDSGEWLSYWLWELDMGRRSDGMEVVQDGKVIPMRTVEDLAEMVFSRP